MKCDITPSHLRHENVSVAQQKKIGVLNGFRELPKPRKKPLYSFMGLQLKYLYSQHRIILIRLLPLKLTQRSCKEPKTHHLGSPTLSQVYTISVEHFRASNSIMHSIAINSQFSKKDFPT